MATLLATLPIVTSEEWHARIVQPVTMVDFFWCSVYYRPRESTAGN
jgi:hypothetical protein